jgi:hypothetical protein
MYGIETIKKINEQVCSSTSTGANELTATGGSNDGKTMSQHASE